MGLARHRMREQLRGNGVSDTVVDDAVLILSELLSNACRHGRPLGQHTEAGNGDIRAAWRVDGRGDLTVEVTDGGGPTRPVPSTPSVTARGGRGLNIISALAQEWGVRDDAVGEVTVWALVSSGRHGHGGFPTAPPSPARNARTGRTARTGRAGRPSLDGLHTMNGFGSLDGLELADVLDAFDDAS
ncbi:ATP-binding protein [Streptomyces sp. NPDC006296]|uniref:ATP-binding protein n=1 Tax=Streptomyces sp. NPDC006296 TaxID=3156746 RepID=UPI0033B1F59E